MKDYKGFRYILTSPTSWRLVYPGGFKTTVAATDEIALKQIIDTIESNFKEI